MSSAVVFLITDELTDGLHPTLDMPMNNCY